MKIDKVYELALKIAKFSQYMETPLGTMEFLAVENALLAVMFVEEKKSEENPNEITKEAVHQFEEYFQGKRKTFNLKIKFLGTEFQNRVWNELLNIPYGETISYSEQSLRINNPKAVRAVGGANSKNIFTILAPCHRVIGKNKTLTGYAGGLDKKQWLLDFESRNR